MSDQPTQILPRLRDAAPEPRHVPAKDTALYQGALQEINRQDAKLKILRVALERIADEETPDPAALARLTLDATADRRERSAC